MSSPNVQSTLSSNKNGRETELWTWKTTSFAAFRSSSMNVRPLSVADSSVAIKTPSKLHQIATQIATQTAKQTSQSDLSHLHDHWNHLGLKPFLNWEQNCRWNITTSPSTGPKKLWRTCGKMLQLAARLPSAHHLSHRQWHSSQLLHATPAAFASRFAMTKSGKIQEKSCANQRTWCFLQRCCAEFTSSIEYYCYEVLQVYPIYVFAAGIVPARFLNWNWTPVTVENFSKMGLPAILMELVMHQPSFSGAQFQAQAPSHVLYLSFPPVYTMYILKSTKMLQFSLLWLFV